MSFQPGFFPYKPRPSQTDIMEMFHRGIDDRVSVLAEAGAGSGKTVCALAPAIEAAQALDKRVLYLTRTNSQQVQVFRELREISKKARVLGTGIQGRHSTCLLMETEGEWSRATPEELSLLCNDRKEGVRRKQGAGCPFFSRLLESGQENLLQYATANLPTVEEFTAHCRVQGLCPYEGAKLLIRSARLVVAPYVYFLSPFIRARLLDWMNAPIEDLIVVVDEAHNLPEFARQLKSVSLGIKSLQNAISEAQELGGLFVMDNVQVPQFCSRLSEIILQLREEYLIDEDGLVPPGAVEEELMYSFTCTSNRLQAAVANLAAHGEVIRENRRKEGRLPRSHIHSVGAFLALWIGLESDAFVKLIRDDGAPRLEAYCMDPSVAAEPLRRCCAGIHMSGTLSPVEEYRDSLALPLNTRSRSFPSIFPPENRTVLYDPSVTMKYEERILDADMMSAIFSKAAAVCRATERNTAVFFPSYDLMESALSSGFGEAVGRRIFREERGSPQAELMETIDQFKREGRRGQKGAVLLSIVGGRVSEGIDFPDTELEVAVLVGIPYPRPTARSRALQYYYDIKFGKGWDYTVRAPTARRLLQTIGRLIRSETDRGIAVILDRRAVQFREYIPDLKETSDPASDVLAFWDQSTTSTAGLRQRCA